MTSGIRVCTLFESTNAETTSRARRRMEESRWLRHWTTRDLYRCKAIESPEVRSTISCPEYRTREKTDKAE